MRVVSFKLDRMLEELLVEHAEKMGVSKSELIRRALRYYLVDRNKKIYITKRIRVY